MSRFTHPNAWFRARSTFAAPFVVAILAHSASALAQSDPAAARDLLKRGYDLKQQSKCKEAIPLFEESARLDPQPKAYLNLADCEEQAGALGSSQKHWLQVRDIGKRDGNTAIVQEADAHLLALDKRFARLTIRIPAMTPPGSILSRDGVNLGQASIGLPLPVDPGPHVIVFRARGYKETRKDLVLREAENADLTMDIGAAEPPAPVTPPLATPVPTAPMPTPPSRPVDSPHPLGPTSPVTPAKEHSSLRTVAVVVGGAGVAIAATGVILGVVASSQYHDADSDCGLDGIDTFCTSKGASTRKDARTLGNVGTVLFVTGLVAVGGGVGLWFLGDSKSKTAIRATPIVTANAAFASFEGKF